MAYVIKKLVKSTHKKQSNKKANNTQLRELAVFVYDMYIKYGNKKR